MRVVKGLSNWLDEHAAAVARGYDFEPALNGAGEPTWGTYRWEFVMPEADNDPSHF